MGGASSATKQQQQLTLQETKQQMGFQQQLMSLFQSQFASQKSTLDFLQNTLKPVIANAQAGNGFSPEELAAMRTQATDTVSNQFTNAQAALNQKLATSGSPNVTSGVTVGADTALLNAEAQTKAGTQNNITLANAEQARANLFNAVASLSGVAAQQSPNALESGAIEGGSTVAGLGGSQANLQNAITQADSNSFFGKLGGAFATGLGSGLAGFMTGGTNLASIFGAPNNAPKG